MRDDGWRCPPLQARFPSLQAVLLAPTMWHNLLREAVSNFPVPTILSEPDVDGINALAACDVALALSGDWLRRHLIMR